MGRTFDIDIRGDEVIFQFMNALGNKGAKVLENECYRIGIDVRKDIIQSMRNTHRKPGVYYKVGKKIFHQPSAPGFPPAIDKGNLVNRIFVQRLVGGTEVYTENVLYAKFLEFGTRYMEPRPFFEPAIERSNWQQRLRNRIIAERFAGKGIK